MTFNNDAIQIMYLGIAQTVGAKTTDLVDNVFAVKKMLDTLECKRLATSDLERLKKEIEKSVNDYCRSDEVEVANQRLAMNEVLDLAKEELESLTKLLEESEQTEKETKQETEQTKCKHENGHVCSGGCHCHDKEDKQAENIKDEDEAENEDVTAAKILDKSADALSGIIDSLLGMVDTIKTRPEGVPNAFAGKVNEALNSAKELKRGISEEIKRHVAEKEAAARHSINFENDEVESALYRQAEDARKKFASNNGLCHQWRLRKDLFQWLCSGATFEGSTDFIGIADVLGDHIMIKCTKVQKINGKAKECIIMQVLLPDADIEFIAKDVNDMQKIAQSYAQYCMNQKMKDIVDYEGALGFEVDYRRMKAESKGEPFYPESTLAGKEWAKELRKKPWM